VGGERLIKLNREYILAFASSSKDNDVNLGITANSVEFDVHACAGEEKRKHLNTDTHTHTHRGYQTTPCPNLQDQGGGTCGGGDSFMTCFTALLLY
jgi:hypothetical protein